VIGCPFWQGGSALGKGRCGWRLIRGDDLVDNIYDPPITAAASGCSVAIDAEALLRDLAAFL